MKHVLLKLALLILIFSAMFFQLPKKEINYLPLGDSYTICTGASHAESWPYLLTQHLKEKNINITLLDNPARNGYSTQNLIDYELPLLKKLKPNFVTLLIGVNDWVREVPKETFKTNFSKIVNEILTTIENKSNFIIITIPDFGVTPQGKNYGNGRDISKGIAEFNEIIKAEALLKKITVVDIFELTQNMGKDGSLVAKDGLHPSAKEYALWEKLILEKAQTLLKN